MTPILHTYYCTRKTGVSCGQSHYCRCVRRSAVAPHLFVFVAITVRPSNLALPIFNPHFLQFPKIYPLVSIQMSEICVKPTGSPLTKPVKVGFALVETPHLFSFSVKIRIGPISLPVADFEIIRSFVI